MRHKKLLDPDRRDQVREMMAHDGWKVFIEFIEAAVLDDMTKNILNVDMSKQRDDVIIEKARYEGAAKAIREIAKLKEAMRASE